jgi:hypothetical protein
MGFIFRWRETWVSGVIAMSFGKRQSGAGASAQALNVDMPAAQSQAATETTGHPFRSFLGLLACCAGLYWLFVSYAPDILRDHRLAGTWQPAYDLRPMEGKCERTNFVLTTCTAKIKSVASPDQAPITVNFLMLFSGGGGEALVPVRSTKDRTAVSIYYAAETKLWNRTLSFVSLIGLIGLFGLVALLLFWSAVNSFNSGRS